MKNLDVKILTKHLDDPELHTLAAYERHGGYGALRKALKGGMTPEKIHEEVKASNLRGRGGAGFPTGIKWGFLPKQTEKPVYLVINADEGEPGTFKDRLIMERNPHSLIEGCILSCFALKANHCFIYIRGELFKAIKRIEQAIEEARAKGYVGPNVLGTGFRCEIVAHPGAGAYICGEEMALIESLEGKPGQPRNKPPFPAHVGLFGCPTIVNNVETIAYVPWIVENGGQAYSDLGSDRNGGLKIWGVSGSVKRPGLWELPMGIPMRYLIEECAGGMKDGKVMKGVIPGGSSCPPMLAREIDVALDIESIKKAGSMLGTGCVTVFEEGICTVRLAQRIAHFYEHESCGQCTPCREGTGWLYRNVKRLEHGDALEGGLGLLESICNRILGNTICALGDAAAMPIQGFIQRFGDEWAAHLGAGRCPIQG
ncbi:NADH-quinone oxidoreductase subunit NuoF [Myxococcota bacterium]|jgi:NADH-quinone oxidoreductase subunit F|nr:NADH-quinone oxidoreductase subunit NuoF [Myxococcota bacterium]